MSTETIEFNEQFNDAIELIANGANVLVTGKAGTGKSTLLRHYCSTFENPPPVLAPTGIAGLNVGGTTIHRFFGFKAGVTPDEARTKKYAKEKRDLFKNLKLLIIDEISMVRADLFDAIHLVLTKHGPRPGQPFGGVQIVLFGDLYQLSPVVNDEDKKFLEEVCNYATPFFFSANVTERMLLQKIELVKVYRQSDIEFINILNRVRNDHLTVEDLETLNSLVQTEPETSTNSPYVTLTTTNKKVNRVNEQRLNLLQSEEIIFRAEIEGEVTKDDWEQFEETLKLKVGAKVMLIANDPLDRWVNGTLGVIEELRPDQNEIKVQILNEDRTVVVKPYTKPIIRFFYDVGRVSREPVGSISQFPLKLAWAMTVHKSQGQTLSHVIIDSHQGFFADGHLYVALSRCKSMEGLILKKAIVPKDLRVNRSVRRFMLSSKTDYGTSDGHAFIGIKHTEFKMKNSDGNDKVLEMAIVVKQNNNKIRVLTTLIAPLTDVGDVDKHGIFPSDLSLAPTLNEAWPIISRFIDQQQIVAIDFERTIKFITDHLKSSGRLISIEDGISLVGQQTLNTSIPRLTDSASALEIAKATLNTYETAELELNCIPFCNTEDSSTIGRLYSRDVLELPEVSETSCFTYADQLAFLLSNSRHLSKVDSEIALKNLRNISDYNKQNVEEESSLCQMLINSAERDDLISQDESNHLKSVHDLLGRTTPELDVAETKSFRIKKGMKLYISGNFVNTRTGEKITKNQIKSVAEKHELVNLKSVTKKDCDFLVTQDTATMGTNGQKARKYNIPIISLSDFLERLKDQIN